ncbi:hypothetical protein K501DRAFT_333593 [Backusella circina FSU 941]|nr:hypothetical protein K501DRAFT_333593 [Backusella circina FSU 941]
MGTLSTAWTGNKQANISCYSSLTLLFWKGYGSGQVINTTTPSPEVATSEKGLPQSMVSITLVSIGREYMGTRIPSHEVATSEKGLPHSRVSITPVSIGREYMVTRLLLLRKFISVANWKGWRKHNF